jgi:hypothetical protein
MNDRDDRLDRIDDGRLHRVLKMEPHLQNRPLARVLPNRLLGLGEPTLEHADDGILGDVRLYARRASPNESLVDASHRI